VGKCIIVQVCQFIMSEATLITVQAEGFEVTVFNEDATVGTVCVLLL